jgi:hypothetical protein
MQRMPAYMAEKIKKDPKNVVGILVVVHSLSGPSRDQLGEVIGLRRRQVQLLIFSEMRPRVLWVPFNEFMSKHSTFSYIGLKRAWSTVQQYAYVRRREQPEVYPSDFRSARRLYGRIIAIRGVSVEVELENHGNYTSTATTPFRTFPSDWEPIRSSVYYEWRDDLRDRFNISDDVIRELDERPSEPDQLTIRLRAGRQPVRVEVDGRLVGLIQALNLDADVTGWRLHAQLPSTEGTNEHITAAIEEQRHLLAPFLTPEEPKVEDNEEVPGISIWQRVRDNT